MSIIVDAADFEHLAVFVRAARTASDSVRLRNLVLNTMWHVRLVNVLAIVDCPVVSPLRGWLSVFASSWGLRPRLLHATAPRLNSIRTVAHCFVVKKHKRMMQSAQL